MMPITNALEWGIRHGGFDALRSEREGARMGRGSNWMRLLCRRRVCMRARWGGVLGQRWGACRDWSRSWRGRGGSLLAS